MKIEVQDKQCVLRMEVLDAVQLFVPAGGGRIVVHLEVGSNGKLRIIGGASVIDIISGQGMRDKIMP